MRFVVSDRDDMVDILKLCLLDNQYAYSQGFPVQYAALVVRFPTIVRTNTTPRTVFSLVQGHPEFCQIYK